MRVKAIEGLRAWLAMWVLVGHVLEVSSTSHLSLRLPGSLWWIQFAFDLISSPALAVEVFVIISGFVIFLLLDTQHEHYGPYIIRRFARIFPAYAILTVISIPLASLMYWDDAHAPIYAHRIPWTEALRTWQEAARHPIATALLHLTMLHGTIPDSVLYHSPTSLLVPSWSLSLEWQFYLVAPLFAWLVSRCGFWGKIAAAAGLLLQLRLVDHHLIPDVHLGAALPFHAGLFALGAVSYFAYKHMPATKGGVFAIAAVALYLVYRTHGGNFLTIPICIWLGFFALIGDQGPLSPLLSLFTNRVAQYLGKISYSVYLSHFIVLSVVYWMVIKMGAPARVRYLGLELMLGTVAGTIPVSALLYRYIEHPGIGLGRRLAQAWTIRRLRTLSPLHGGEPN